ncbi:MAG: metal-dependent transcriptional regulator [Oscillospiraceae bacterium]|jgi:Mn-dependent DtxR family transcriptional regulator|nr:metal-dependent transcriptional regulator [Oscillospiraceae bacterium]
MDLKSSSEDYLETILLLSRSTDGLHAYQVADAMGFSKPSVSVALKKLRDLDMLTVDDDGHIHLTDAGREAAERVYRRHSVLFDWLVSNGVPEDSALEDACAMEHILSEDTFLMIERLYQTAAV